MTFNNRPLLRIAAVLALSAAATSAFAQSAEYRRGYDDGYAAGLREAGGGGRGEGRGWRIFVEDAEYGTHYASCDARRAVRHQIERNRGAVRADNQLCGDPAHGEPKRLRIVYRCGDSEAVRVVARENETVRLSCRR
ncbi:hypothetical protein IA69_05620 [Massilia sp. JS1662]|nr:hypothetical protein [Massilia sp. JS1662]KGF82746.1 hypothetical protein IA69_05620 [Massilia sp. JS1662]